MDKKNSLDESLMWGMLGTTMNSGIPILMSLNLVRDTFPAYEKEIQYLHDAVREGECLAIPLDTYKDSFHPLAVPLVDIGEETGALPEMLNKCSEVAKRGGSSESLLWYSLGTLTDAGLPLLRSLRVAQKAFPNYEKEMADIGEFVEGGNTFTESLELKKESFNPLVPHIMKNAEANACLEKGFFRSSNLVEYKENVDTSIFYTQKQKDKLTFYKYLSCLMDENIPLLKGIRITNISMNEPYKSISSKIEEDLENGSMFSEAMAQHDVFTPLEYNMIRAGEAGGVLDIVMTRTGDHLRKVYNTNAMKEAYETIEQIAKIH
tara:strand:+ start:2078 stop:3037 length:960 start_codon:yes stop_codon:yes gene_type:complete